MQLAWYSSPLIAHDEPFLIFEWIVAMDFLNHDIAHEFPEYLARMRALKTSSQRFANLFAEYDEDNHAIARYEKGQGAITDEALEALKKKRLKTKDDIYQMLKNDRQV